MNATRSMSEEWRPVPGYEGAYEVSNRGEVKSIRRVVDKKNGSTQTIPERIVAPSTTNSGHRFCALWKGNKRKRVYIHRMVAMAFLGGPPDSQEVCHNDGDPQNNFVENLRWGTRSENMRDEVIAGRHWQTAKTHCKHGHEFTIENTIIRKGGRGRTCRKCNVVYQRRYQERKRSRV